MNKSFFHLPSNKKITLLTHAAEQLDLSELILEKDVWVCWLLEKIFSLPTKMAFKGGTSLSKVFNLISRVSKDFLMMVDAGMFYKDPPAFDEIISSLKKLEADINYSIPQDTNTC